MITRNGLIRSEVIEQQRVRLFGDVIIKNSARVSNFLYLIYLVVLSILTYMAFVSYEVSEGAIGHLVPNTGMIVIETSKSGTLDKIYVVEGQGVLKGQVLAIIKTGQDIGDGGPVGDQALRLLEEEVFLIEARVGRIKSEYGAETAKINGDIAETNFLIKSLAQRLNIQDQIAASAKREFENGSKLVDKGYISKAEIERRRQTMLSQRLSILDFEQNLTIAKSKRKSLIEDQKISLEQLNGVLGEQEKQRLDIKRRQGEIVANQSFSIKAPASGRIASFVRATPGRSVKLGETLMTIVPEGSHLEVEVFLSSRAVRQAKGGQKVNMELAAFPANRYGHVVGHISHITEQIYYPGQLPILESAEEPLYRVIVGIDPLLTNKRIDMGRLRMGMRVDAQLVVREESLLSLLMAPFKGRGA